MFLLFFYLFTGVNMASQPVSLAQSQVPVAQQQATPIPIQATPSPPQTTPQHTQLFVQQQNTAFFTAQQQVTATKKLCGYNLKNNMKSVNMKSEFTVFTFLLHIYFLL